MQKEQGAVWTVAGEVQWPERPWCLPSVTGKCVCVCVCVCLFKHLFGPRCSG